MNYTTYLNKIKNKMSDLKDGTEIIFNKNIYNEANSESPCLLLARKNEKGKIIRKGSFGFEYYVQTEDKNPFYCNRIEFEIKK